MATAKTTTTTMMMMMMMMIEKYYEGYVEVIIGQYIYT